MNYEERWEELVEKWEWIDKRRFGKNMYRGERGKHLMETMHRLFMDLLSDPQFRHSIASEHNLFIKEKLLPNDIKFLVKEYPRVIDLLWK